MIAESDRSLRKMPPPMSAHDTQPFDMSEIVRATGPYPIEAFNFVREGLSFTAGRVHGELEIKPEIDRHVSGQQLCLGLRDYAIERYGLMASDVLAHWNVQRTDDFGRIVFALVDGGLMSKTSRDDLEDFRSVFDFGEAFCDSEVLERIIG